MIKIVSTAQHAMLTKVANDPAYAKRIGMSSDMAQEALDAHKAAGEPKLPDRAEPRSVAPRAAPKTSQPVFLQSMKD